MSFGDFMGMTAAIAGILGFVGILAKVYARHLAFREKALELTASRTAEKAAQYAARSEALEARVRVLERIATDRSNDLATRIEDLREPSLN
jgi:hypothetical protein